MMVVIMEAGTCFANIALRRHMRLIAGLVAVTASAGCYTRHLHTQLSGTDNLSVSAACTPAPAYQYEKSEVQFTNHLAGKGATAAYELRMLEIPSVGDNGQTGNLVTARYFRSIKPGPRPLVIVLPIWGTYTYPPRKTSSSIQRLSDGAVHVLHVQGDDYVADWSALVAAENEAEFLGLWRQATERLRVHIIDVRRLIDWAEHQPEIDSGRVALVGFSISAIVAGTIATQEPRFAATVTVMGGSHLHSVLAYCDGRRATSIQVKAHQSFGWGHERLEAELESVMSVLDSANYPNRVDPRSVLIIDAERDKCVPEASREDLWLTLGKPERITLAYDHAPAFYAMTPFGNNWLRQRIWDFLESRLLRQPLTRPGVSNQ